MDNLATFKMEIEAMFEKSFQELSQKITSTKRTFALTQYTGQLDGSCKLTIQTDRAVGSKHLIPEKDIHSQHNHH